MTAKRLLFGYLTSTVIALIHERSNLLSGLSRISLNQREISNLMQQ